MQGKVAVVTGSTSGIGLGIIRKLASLGCHVVVHGLADPVLADALVSELQSTYGVQAVFVDADLSTKENAQKLIHETIKIFGRVDILVNNAGIQYVESIEDFPLAQWQKIMDINLTAPFVLIKEAVPVMKKSGWGRIINIVSTHGLVASVKKSAYVAAKHGLIGLNKAVALEMAATPITCNAVCPGWVLTPLVSKQIEDRSKASGRSFEEEKKIFLLEKHPSGEFVTPEQVAGVVAFLCSADADQMRGSCITVDGGWTIQ